MNRILAIADDLSGAAEIAGAGWRFGLAARVLREPAGESFDGLTVVDTDSRLLPPRRAASVVRQFAAQVRADDYDLIYKKTDSVLRGPVRAEIEALLDALKLKKSLLVPQNPSRGRTIGGGIYRIEGVPLDQTHFRDDPDHPARTSVAAELLGASDRIAIGDALGEDDVRQHARSVTHGVLPAGGVDFFEANLTRLDLRPCQSFSTTLPGKSKLFVCGSASEQSRRLVEQFHERQFAVCAMPDAVFLASSTTGQWIDQIVASLGRSSCVLVAIDRPVDPAPGAGARLQQVLADTVARVFEEHPVDTLLLEGGATASAVCRRVGWNRFEVEGELGAGAVVLRAGDARQRIAVKPGSYPWPACVWA